MIEESIGKGITKNADNSYTLDFKQDLGSGTWDGVFYVKVPPVTTGDELKNSNISNEKNEINTKYIQNTTTLPAACLLVDSIAAANFPLLTATLFT